MKKITFLKNINKNYALAICKGSEIQGIYDTLLCNENIDPKYGDTPIGNPMKTYGIAIDYENSDISIFVGKRLASECRCFRCIYNSWEEECYWCDGYNNFTPATAFMKEVIYYE